MNLALLKRHAPLLAGVALLAALFGGSYLVTPKQTQAPAYIKAHARDVIARCASESYPPSCYDIEIPKLMDEGLSLEDAFAVTAVIQDERHDYFYCHVLGHNVSAKETAKDPSAWTEVVSRCPTGMCSNGCLHGAAQERFREETLTSEQIDALIPELSTICEQGGSRDYTGLEQASCYHSMGHLSMYISGADIDVATNVCDRIAVKEDADYTQTCYEGAYMQIFQPLEPEDFALVAHIPAKTIPEAKAFCDQYEGERHAACYRESWPLYRSTFDAPGGLADFCALVPDPVSEQRCYNGMFYVLAAQYNFEMERIEPLCLSLPEKRMAQCFANSASRLIETDYRLIPDAVALCETAASYEAGERCYDELLFYSSFNFHEGSDAFNALCRALPEPWEAKCLNGEGGDIFPSTEDY